MAIRMLMQLQIMLIVFQMSSKSQITIEPGQNKYFVLVVKISLFKTARWTFSKRVWIYSLWLIRMWTWLNRKIDFHFPFCLHFHCHCDLCKFRVCLQNRLLCRIIGTIRKHKTFFVGFSSTRRLEFVKVLLAGMWAWNLTHNSVLSLRGNPAVVIVHLAESKKCKLTQKHGWENRTLPELS